jgi:hypothetical protein
MSKATLSQDRRAQTWQVDDTAFWNVFGHETAAVNNVRIHYAIGGTGPALVLLHGFPEPGASGAWSCQLSRMLATP